MKKKVLIYLQIIGAIAALIFASPVLLYVADSYISEKTFARNALPNYLKYEKVILSKASYGFKDYCEVALYEANEVGLRLIEARDYQAPFFRSSNKHPLPDGALYLIENAVYCLENRDSIKVVMQLIEQINNNTVEYFYLYTGSSKVRIVIPSKNKILHLGYNG